MFYGYLNLESTKTSPNTGNRYERFYGYLNLESTKTTMTIKSTLFEVLRLLKS